MSKQSLNVEIRDAFFHGLLEVASLDESIVVLTVDHGALGLDIFKEKLPQQYFNCGIAEQNIIGIAAGMAKIGFRPFVYGISSFIVTRALEQIMIDVCANNLPVTIIGAGAGLTYSTDGPTHHSLIDLPITTSIANLQIYSCSNGYDVKLILNHSIASDNPKYIRLEKGTIRWKNHKNFSNIFDVAIFLKHTKSCNLLISHGKFLDDFYFNLEQKTKIEEINFDILNLYRLDQLSFAKIESLLNNYEKILFVSESYFFNTFPIELTKKLNINTLFVQTQFIHSAFNDKINLINTLNINYQSILNFFEE